MSRRFSVWEWRRREQRGKCSPGFLEGVKDGKEKRISGFVRSGNWPPPATFFEGGAIGLAYFLPSWFRYNLQAWIHDRMHELESKEGVYSLEGWQAGTVERNAVDFSYVERDLSRIPLLIRESTGVTASNGCAVAGDSSLMRKPLDLSELSLEWVESTNDHLFGELSKNERLLYPAGEMEIPGRRRWRLTESGVEVESQGW